MTTDLDVHQENLKIWDKETAVLWIGEIAYKDIRAGSAQCF